MNKLPCLCEKKFLEYLIMSKKWWFLFVFKQSLRWLYCLPLWLQSYVEFAGCQIFIFNLYFSVDLSILIWLQIIISGWQGCQNEPATGALYFLLWKCASCCKYLWLSFQYRCMTLVHLLCIRLIAQTLFGNLEL